MTLAVMSDDYEQRARRSLDDLTKMDPELAALDREETIKEVAAGLKKAESASGGAGSPWPATSELLKAPFTGRLHGVEVERGLWPWGLILLKAFGAVVGPIFGLIQWVGFWNLSRSGYDAHLTDDGVEVFSKCKGHVATYECSEIAQLRRIFEPPLMIWELVLTNGKEVSLPLAELNPSDFRARGITVHEQHKFRSQYQHDG